MTAAAVQASSLLDRTYSTLDDVSDLSSQAGTAVGWATTMLSVSHMSCHTSNAFLTPRKELTASFLVS